MSDGHLLQTLWNELELLAKAATDETEKTHLAHQQLRIESLMPKRRTQLELLYEQQDRFSWYK